MYRSSFASYFFSLCFCFLTGSHSLCASMQMPSCGHLPITLPNPRRVQATRQNYAQKLCLQQLSHQLMGLFFLFVFFLLLAALHNMWNFSSPTRLGVEPEPPCSGSIENNHWTSRKVPGIPFLSLLHRMWIIRSGIVIHSARIY